MSQLLHVYFPNIIRQTTRNVVFCVAYYLELRNAMTSYRGSMLYGHYTTLKKHSLNLLKHTFVASRNSE